ncbi:ParB N-terminal domain-containing protein [Fortiea contorta]|uniref:ParB N-terminal domain-containing protein n=1 Tax=Fortiea contorta TaxID=1892405 RepID=UPI0003454D35|nr:ParB N-terminal domain-containing protein [Fortiea contorta]
MKLSTSLVAVKKITSITPRSSFADNQLEQGANLILESEGVINPIVVRRTSLQSYEIVDGDFEYHAAARAREIDPRKGEMIGVFIIEDENEEVLTKQVELFRKSKSIISNNIASLSDSKEYTSTNMELRVTNTESRMNNIESHFDNRTIELRKEFRQEINNINERLKEIENRIPKPIEPLNALNNLSLPELTSKLRRVNVNQKIIESIVNERKNGDFKSFSNAVDRIKGLGDKTMLKIIDSLYESTI